MRCLKLLKMNILRAFLVGALVWLCILVTFAILAEIPTVKDSSNIQALIVALLIIPFAACGASIYYKNGNIGNGLVLGLLMSATALLLDALVTVPLIEIPQGNTYGEFFSYPLLWILVAINIATVYMFWKLRLNRQ